MMILLYGRYFGDKWEYEIVRDKTMTETITFRPKLATPIKYFLLNTCLFTGLLYLWKTLEHWIYLAIAFIPLLGVIGLGKPLLFLQHVIIGEDKTITIRYWFGKGYTEKIAKALYEVLKNNENEIRSYRFNIQGRRFQVSPCVYERGENLAEILEPFARRKGIRVKSAIFR